MALAGDFSFLVSLTTFFRQADNAAAKAYSPRWRYRNDRRYRGAAGSCGRGHAQLRPLVPPGWVFQFTGGDMVGCYRWGLEYGTFDCFSNTPAGSGCDADGCFIGS